MTLYAIEIESFGTAIRAVRALKMERRRELQGYRTRRLKEVPKVGVDHIVLVSLGIRDVMPTQGARVNTTPRICPHKTVLLAFL